MNYDKIIRNHELKSDEVEKRLTQRTIIALLQYQIECLKAYNRSKFSFDSIYSINKCMMTSRIEIEHLRRLFDTNFFIPDKNDIQNIKRIVANFDIIERMCQEEIQNIKSSSKNFYISMREILMYSAKSNENLMRLKEGSPELVKFLETSCRIFDARHSGGGHPKQSQNSKHISYGKQSQKILDSYRRSLLLIDYRAEEQARASIRRGDLQPKSQFRRFRS